MTIANLLKRLDRIEAKRGTSAIRNLVGFRPLTRDEAAEAVTNWQTWVEDGRARRFGDTLYILAPRLTAAEWSAQRSRRETMQ